MENYRAMKWINSNYTNQHGWTLISVEQKKPDIRICFPLSLITGKTEKNTAKEKLLGGN